MKNFKILFVFTITAFFAFSAFANPAFAKDKTAADMEKQIEALQKRVDDLEAEKKRRQSATSVAAAADSVEKMWNPYEEIYRMQEEMNRMFRHSLKTRGDLNKGLFSNSMGYDDNFKIKEQKDKYIIEADIKGLNKAKIDIEINNNYITIKGEQNVENKQESKDSYVSSKSYSSFMRTIALPADADTSNVKSEQKGDTLVITFPKKK